MFAEWLATRTARQERDKLARLQVTTVRTAYPRPRATGLMKRDTYCVGGAFILANGGIYNWPTYDKLADALQVNNPRLPRNRASGFACAIIHWNDFGIKWMAWRTLQKALAWG